MSSLNGATSVQALDHKRLAETARHAFILPRYAELGDAVEKLGSALSVLCAKPGGQSLARIRHAYRDAVVAWGKAEIISFGPVTRNKRYERIFF